MSAIEDLFGYFYQPQGKAGQHVLLVQGGQVTFSFLETSVHVQPLWYLWASRFFKRFEKIFFSKIKKNQKNPNFLKKIIKKIKKYGWLVAFVGQVGRSGWPVQPGNPAWQTHLEPLGKLEFHWNLFEFFLKFRDGLPGWSDRPAWLASPVFWGPGLCCSGSDIPDRQLALILKPSDTYTSGAKNRSSGLHQPLRISKG